MIELRNRQYMYILDCVAGEDLEVGQVLSLDNNVGTDLDGELPLAFAATQAGDVIDVVGPLFAHWINDRSEAVAFSGGEDGLTFPLAASTDADSNHYIPSGRRMLALGGKGFAEIRFFESSLDAEYAGALPDPLTVLRFSSTTSKLCSAANANVVAKDVALVVENDGVSISVVIG